jgi:lysozyme family protein
MTNARTFLRDPQGFTGAERALIACAALAVVLTAGALLSRGSGEAAGDAERVLRSGTGTVSGMPATASLQAPRMIRAAAALQTTSALPPSRPNAIDPPAPTEAPTAAASTRARTFTDAVYKKHVTLTGKAKVNLQDAGMKADLARFQRNWELNRARYEAVAAQTGVPAPLIAALHWRESTGNFNTYLHQGDPLGRPATHVPRNIPVFHKWEDAAVHALNLKKNIRDDLSLTASTTDTAAMATYAEYYNGLGYHKRGKPSPYVYSGTDQYQRGKFVRDGVYDPNHRDRQLGVITMIESIRPPAPAAPAAPAPEGDAPVARVAPPPRRPGPGPGEAE